MAIRLRLDRLRSPIAAILLLLLSGCGSSASQTLQLATHEIDQAQLPVVPGQCSYQGQLPDPACTPGEVDPAINQNNIQITICVTGYTTKVRPPVSYTEPLKVQSMRAYRDTKPASSFEFDHRVPLEVAGAPRSILNLWPEGYERTGAAPTGQGSESKDRLENFIHKLVCSGQMSLADGQAVFMGDFLSWMIQHNV